MTFDPSDPFFETAVARLVDQRIAQSSQGLMIRQLQNQAVDDMTIPATLTQPTRALGTTYQPSTTRPTLVCVNVICGASGAGASGVECLVGAASPPTTRMAYVQFGNTASTLYGACTFLVPPAFYYRINANSSSNAPAIQSVTEWAL